MGKLFDVIAAVPAIRDLIDAFFKAWAEHQVAGMKQEIRDGIRKAFQDYDQRELEKAIGSPRAGEPSGVAGAERRDTIAGL